MRYGLFDDNGNYCGYDTDSYEFAQERAAALNERYQQGLEENFYHVEEIDDDDSEELAARLDTAYASDIPF